MRLTTPRLLVRSFTTADVGPFSEIVADPEVMRYLGKGGPLTVTEAHAYIQKYLEMETISGYSRNAVILRDTDKLVGMCGLVDLGDYVDLGYRFSRAYWGMGIATEAASAVIKHGFDVLGIEEVTAIVAKENKPSIKVVEKLGFLRIGEAETDAGIPSFRYLKQR